MKYPKLNTSLVEEYTRQKSVFIALKNIRKKRIKTRNDIVLIHDAARPFFRKSNYRKLYITFKKI